MRIQRASTEGQPPTQEAALNAIYGLVLVVAFGVLVTLVVCGIVGIVALLVAI